MTEFVIRLKTAEPLSRAQAYQIYGDIASCLSPTSVSCGLELIEITDDVTATPSEPATPVRTRKPRGPNKPKVTVSGATGSGASVTELQPQNRMDIPASLKRDKAE